MYSQRRLLQSCRNDVYRRGQKRETILSGFCDLAKQTFWEMEHLKAENEEV